ncbi:MAG: HK97-fold major capsid protein [Elusimicrobiota bacterium]
MSLPKNGDNLTDNEKQELIAQALQTEEGRVSLAQAMVEPIRRSLEYQAVGRKLLMIDELPQGALPRYERDVAAIAHVIARRGAVPNQIQEGEEIIVPTFEIAAHPTVRLSEIKARRFYIVDRAQIKAKEAIQKEEDSNIFAALTAAANNNGSQIVNVVGTLTTTSLNQAYYYIEQHDLVATKIVLHANQYKAIRVFGKDFYDEATTREIITTGLYGHLWTADIHVSSRMQTSDVLVVASADTVGAFPIRQDITVLPADDPVKLRLGWVIYEEVGIVVINDYAVSLIDVASTGS